MGRGHSLSFLHWDFSLIFVLLFGLNVTFALVNSHSNQNSLPQQLNEFSFQNPVEFGFDKISFQGFLRSGKLLNLDSEEDPNDVAGSFFAGVSDKCREHSLLWLKELRSWSTRTQFQVSYESLSNNEVGETARLKFPSTWAIQMLDAWGKFPAGILSGHTQSLGDFGECLQIRASENNAAIFKGQYCLTRLGPTDKFNLSAIDSNDNLRESVSIEEFIALLMRQDTFNMLPLIGTCFPSSCSKEDTSMLFHNFYDTLLGGVLDQSVLACYTDEKPPFNAGDISMIIILGLIAGFCVLGTALDVLVYQKISAESQKKKGNGFRAILAFSLYTNTKKWADTRSGSGDLGCLHGIRFLSICWIVWAHTFQSLDAVWNIVDAKKIHEKWSMLLIINGSVSVDTFFVLSGTLVAYTMLRHLEGTRGKLNIPLLYFHRLCRLTPMYMLVIGMIATIGPYLGSGPFWYWKEEEARKCQKNWWKNMLYVSNLIDTGKWGEKMCYAGTWYISNDMQFYILSPFIVLALWRSKVIGFVIIGVLMLTTTVTSTVIAAVKEYPAGDTPYDLYYKPWCRMHTYLIGMVLGYIFYRQKSVERPLKIRKLPNWLVLLFWLLSTFLALLVLFVNRPYWKPELLNPESPESLAVSSTTKILGYIYLGYHRFVWGISIAWIIFACVNGYGGWVNSFLSWSAFIPLGRITFAIYLIAVHLQTIFHRSSYTSEVFGMYYSVYMLFAHLVISCFMGFILTVTVEVPFLQLEKIFLTPGAKK